MIQCVESENASLFNRGMHREPSAATGGFFTYKFYIITVVLAIQIVERGKVTPLCP